MSVVADTHAAIWYVDAPHELSDAATAALDAAAATGGEHIIISAITLVEIHYLVEKNRVKASVLTRIKQELDEPDPMIIVVSLRPVGRRHAGFDPAPCRARHARPYHRRDRARPRSSARDTRYGHPLVN